MTTILILDDDESIRSTLRMLFEDEGYTVVTFAQGSEALTYLRGQHIPHIVITDYLMPEMTGTEFLHAAQREFATLGHCYLLIAARPPSQMPAGVNAALAAWRIPYLQKPFDVSDILGAVAACPI